MNKDGFTTETQRHRDDALKFNPHSLCLCVSVVNL